METQENAVAEEEQHICKKCEKRLPNKSYFCMYCGTDNSPTSIQVEYEKANNESLRKYTIIKTAKKTIPWYLLFLFLIIDVIAINFTLLMNHDDMFVKVNSANFQNYEKTYYIAEDAYLAVKDNKIKIIGSNRLDYIETIRDIQQFEFKDIQETYNSFGRKVIYLQTSKNIIYSLSGTTLEKIETEQDYIDIYHYINDQKSNCYNSTEYTLLEAGIYYYDVDKSEVLQVGQEEYINNNNKVCKNYKRTTVIDNNELALEKPELVYQSAGGEEIILKNNKEIVEISYGRIENRYEELTLNGKTIKVEDIKKVFYDSNKLTVIDKKDDIYISDLGTSSDIETETNIINNNIKIDFSKLDKDTKTNLIILLVLLIGDLIFLYKMSDKHTFSKCMTMSVLIMLEYIFYTVFRGSGFELNSGEEFLLLLKTLAIVYLLIVIISTVVIQISELVIKLLDLIKFRNIFSYILSFTAITSIFLNVLNSGNDGLFFAVFLLGSYWSHFTEVEDVDIDLFITPSSRVPIIVLSVANLILYFVLLNIFKINNYFVMLFLIAILYAVYLAARPELAKKELTGKSVKSLLVVIMALVYNFILTLLTMDLFNKLVKDDGTIMKYVLATGFEYILYLVVAFIFLILVSSILRVLHKIVKVACKNTNTVVSCLVFSIIALVLFSMIIFFYPEILNLIHVGVSRIFNTVIK